MGNLVDEARNGSLEGVRRALDEGQPIDQKNGQGDTAVLWAVSKNRIEILQLLLDRGADAGLAARDGTTPLELATRDNHFPIARLLEFALTRRREPKESWEKMGASTVAHVGIYPEIDERLTSVFNFASRERFIISEGLKDHHKAVGPSTSFDALPQPAVVEALEQFTKLGGVADRDFVLGGRSTLDKPKLTVP